MGEAATLNELISPLLALRVLFIGVDATYDSQTVKQLVSRGGV